MGKIIAYMGGTVLSVSVLAWLFVVGDQPQSPATTDAMKASSERSEMSQSGAVLMAATGSLIQSSIEPANTLGVADVDAESLKVSQGISVLMPVLSRTSLRGTEIDGRYTLDVHGQLLVSKAIKQRFDYFLSLMGEKTLSEIDALVQLDMAQVLSAEAERQAYELWQAYLAYQQALVQLEADFPHKGFATGTTASAFDSFQRQFDALENTRLWFFSPTQVAAFFGDDLAYDRLTLEKMALKQNTQLTEQQKASRLDSLGQMEVSSEFMARQQGMNDTLANTQILQANGATEEEVYQLHLAAFGEPAAQRLQQVQQQRQQFSQKVSAYLEEKQQLEENSGLSLLEKNTQLQALKDQYFSPLEQKRLPALEAIAKA